MKLFFASSNPGKIRELRAVLHPDIELAGLAEAGIATEIEETGTSISENSLLKAQYVYDHLLKQGQEALVIADDSGLEVEALDGAPGVFSARYAGEPKNDAANNRKLLYELKQVTKRQARFVTVITLIKDGREHYFEGEVKGTIAHEPRGDNGFGYDPLFIPQGYRSTFAELPAEVKNSISHRSKAVRALVEFLTEDEANT